MLCLIEFVFEILLTGMFSFIIEYRVGNVDGGSVSEIDDCAGVLISITSSSSISVVDGDNNNRDIPIGIDSAYEIENDNNNSDLATCYVDNSIDMNTLMPTSSSSTLVGRIGSRGRRR
jgi:hypothetical protein